MKTSAIFFPFDLFGNSGTAAGVNLVADELREILADNKRESVPTRARAYTDKIRLRECSFETIEDYTHWRGQGRKLVRQALRNGDFLLWVTGNHLGALPVYDELADSKDVLILQLDAHLDIHHFRDCTPELSHGNFLLHCAGSLPPLLNIGHRDLLLTADHINRTFRATYSAVELAVDPGRVYAAIRSAAQSVGRVFVDIDCDVFDPAFFPGVGQPVPFGLTPPQVLAVLEAVFQTVGSAGLAGLSVSEFDPGRDRDDRSLAILVWLLEYVLLRLYELSPGK